MRIIRRVNEKLLSGTMVRLIITLMAVLLLTPPALAQEPSPASVSDIDPAEVDALVEALENPEARQRLIEQLRLLQQATETEAGPPEVVQEIHSAGAVLLNTLSHRVQSIGRAAINIAASVNQLPAFWTWLEKQATVPDKRRLWGEVLLNLFAVLAIGYLAALGVRPVLRRMENALLARPPTSWSSRGFTGLALFAAGLVPVAAFALAAYATLSIMDPRELTRLVAVAWINASIIVRLIAALNGGLLSPRESRLRPLPISDETAHYAEIWINRLAFTAVYGYFALQAAVLLGLPASPYTVLLNLLGLVLTVLVAVLVVQNREPVARWLRGSGEASKGIRGRFAAVWHLLGVVYVFILYGIWALDIGDGFAYLFKSTALTLFVLVASRLVLLVLARLFDRGFRVSDELKARFPGLEARTNRYVPTVHTGTRWVVYLFTALALMQAWGVNAFAWLLGGPGQVLGSRALTVIVIAVVAVAVWELASSMIQRHLAEQDKEGHTRVVSARTKTLLTVARNAILAVVVVMSTLLILSELGINIAPLLAGAGVVGLAVGFGAQTLVKDIITGAFILFQDQMAVGEVVKVGDTAGLVEGLSIRHVRLRDLTGTVHTIPFSSIDSISNLTKEFSFYVFDIGVAYRENVDHVINVLKQIGDELLQDPEFGPLILEPFEMLGVDKFADSAVIIKARIKTLPIKQWSVGREFHRRMKNRFDELGIEIPFPHRTMYFGVDQEGKAPPARIEISPGIGAQASPLRALGPGPDEPVPERSAS